MGASTQYGVNFALAASPTPSTCLTAAQWDGKLRCQCDLATASANSDIGSLIYVGKLRKGVLPIATLIHSSNVSNAVTGTIGWAGDAAALGTFTTLATHLAQLLPPGAPNVPLTEDRDVYITVAGANGEAADLIATTIFYVEN